jgi:UDP-N-acetylmuramate dehydrogenase
VFLQLTTSKTGILTSEGMEVSESKQLKDYTSMRIGGPAAYFITVRTEDDVAEAARFAKEKALPVITLGDGTNVVFSDDGFSGVVIHNKISGFSIDEHGLAHIGAGENWDSVVARTIEAGFYGIEAMSLIPGTTGATPVNNVGAYGQEIADTLISVRAFDTVIGEFVTMPANECRLNYRTSRFKIEDYGRFIITEITLQLTAINKEYQAPSYPSLSTEFAKFASDNLTPAQVRSAVIAVRTSRLPDPKVVANVGSFFKNAIVDKPTADKLSAAYPDAPIYAYDQGFKVASGWLIETAGLKNYRTNGMWVYDKQALVLINESAEHFSDLKIMYEHIQKTVFNKFGIALEPEPELL